MLANMQIEWNEMGECKIISRDWKSFDTTAAAADAERTKGNADINNRNRFAQLGATTNIEATTGVAL